ncbi:MAG: polysaccharide biosynthesis tyrosine autokinase [bacterium]|nr:polysaccharide biosynthesis tyrosine autokinase [bacterium]
MDVKESTLQEYIYVLLTKKWVVISIFAITVLTAIFYLIMTPKVYESVATIMIEPPQISASNTMYPGNYLTNIRNYCEILKSETVMQHAVDKLASSGLKFKFLNSSFPADVLSQRVSIRPIMDSDIIKIYGRGSTVEEAMALTDAVVDGFIKEQLLVARKEFSEQRKFIEKQIPEVEKGLIEIEENIRDFKETNKIIGLSEEAKELVRKLTDIDVLYVQSEASCNAINTQLTSLKQQLDKHKSSFLEDVTSVSTPYILQLRKELLSLETNFSLYVVQGLSEKDPKLMDIENSIEKTKEQLINETRKIIDKNVSSKDPLSVSEELVDNVLKLEVELSVETTKKTSFYSILTSYEKYLYSFPTKEFQLAQLERKRNLNNNTYDILMKNFETTKLAEAGRLSDIRIVDRADTPKIPVKPKIKLVLILSIFIGLSLGVGSAFIIEYVGSTVKTSKDVRLHFNMSVIGNIPKVKSVKAGNGNGLLTHYPMNSPVYEAYRSLRTNLSFISPDVPIKTILLTSALPGEGKTTVASNLGIVMAQLEKKVLLVDTDLRKMSLTRCFGIKSEIGVTDVLLDEKMLKKAIVETEIENLSILPGGKVPPNPAELISSKRMYELIEKLKEEFSFVIFDSPPVLSVTDSAILASKLDSVMLVIQANKTNRLAIARAKEMLEQTNVKLLNIILNMIPLNFPMYGYPYYYSYYSTSQEPKSHKNKPV